MLRLEQAGIDLLAPGRTTRLRFADLSLEPGGLLLLQGPSGSGKSTLISLLCGLRLASHGRVLVDGVDPASLKMAARDRWRGRTIGLMPQRLHLSAALDVTENLLLAALAAGTPAPTARERAARLLEQLGLASLARARTDGLSGGQAQRVALARALINQPRLLIADEPTANLDDQAAARSVEQLLAGWRSSDATLLVATHDVRVLTPLRDACPTMQSLLLSAPEVSP